MKRFLLFSAAVGWLCSAGVQASPIYYTFEGTITNTNDGAGVLAANGLAVGDAISYTVMMDFAIQGTYTRNDGYVYTYPDTGCLNCTNDSFYADYISGSAITGVGSTHPYDIAEYNRGWDFLCWTPCNGGGHHYSGGVELTSGEGWFSGGLTINSSTKYMSDLVIGDIVSVQDYAGGPGSTLSSLQGSLTVTTISSTYSAVPEPATFILVGLGLVGIGCGRRVVPCDR